MSRSWWKAQPELAEAIRKDLARHFPNLHLYVARGKAELRGTFPVRGPDGRDLDEYLVEIELPPGFPEDLPIVREVGERIPKVASRHVNEKDGSACVLLPDERWRSFPIGASLLDYLRGPLHNFLLGQTHFEATGEWPFGEWRHGRDGILDYYESLLGTDDLAVIRSTLEVLSRKEVRGHWSCPCGSGQRLRECCTRRIQELRQKITAQVASSSLRQLG